MKTLSTRREDAEHDWYVVDAENQTLGRLATEVARRLRGKHKAAFTPHVDTGDYIVVVNAEKVRVSGNKTTDKTYYRHSGYPGGIKERKAGQILDGKHPERLLQSAVRRMMPDGPLARKQLGSLKVYSGPDHPHEAQKPEKLDVAKLNTKNARND